MFWLNIHLYKDASVIASSSKVGLSLLGTQRGISEINSLSQLSVSLVLSQRELREEAGHSFRALLDSMLGMVLWMVLCMGYLT